MKPAQQPSAVRQPGAVVRPGEGRSAASGSSVDAEINSRLQAIRGMSSDQVKALQQKIGVNPDGKFGEGSRGALRAYILKQRVESKEREAKATANVAKLRAEAELAKARAAAERKKAEQAKVRQAQEKRLAEQAKVRQAQEKRLAEEAEAQRAGLIRLASIAAGGAIAVGTDIGITKFIGKSVDARNAALAGEAKKLQGLIPKLNKPSTTAGQRTASKALAIVKANKHLLRGRGPGGFVVAGVLAGKAAVEYGLASQYEDGKIEKTILNAAATGATTTAIIVTGMETFRRSQPQKFIKPEIRSAFAQAEALAKGTNPAVAQTALKAGKTAPGRGATGPTVAELRQQAKARGITNASRMRKTEIMSALEKGGKIAPQSSAVTRFARGAVRAVGKSLTPIALGLAGLAGWAAYSQARAAGRSGIRSSAIGLGTAADNFVGAPIEGTRRLARAIADNKRNIRKVTYSASDLSGIDIRMPMAPRPSFAEANAGFVAKRDAQRQQKRSVSGIVSAHTRRSGNKFIKVDSRAMTRKEIRARQR